MHGGGGQEGFGGLVRLSSVRRWLGWARAAAHAVRPFVKFAYFASAGSSCADFKMLQCADARGPATKGLGLGK